MDRILSNYKRSENALVDTSERVINETENNPDFPTLPPALAELKKVLPEFRLARANAMGRDKKMVSIKNDMKVIVQALLQQVADFMTATCKGNRTLLLSSGFDITGESNSGQTPSIRVVKVELGESGVATIHTREVTAVKAYIHQYATEPPGANTIWVQEGSSQGEHTFSGLTPDKRHWFRVVAIGYGKQKAYSPIVSRVIE